jgi:hypothetical protein
MWRGNFNMILNHKVCMDSYNRIMGVCEPKEGFEDRGRLYSVYPTLHESAFHNGGDVRDQ